MNHRDNERIFKAFLDPPVDYSPVPFWFLNDRLEGKRLEWQVAEMHDKHVYGAIMHARPGLVTEYLSDAWFDAMGSIIRKAADLSMFMWIYDEYPWMSGMAEWRVPRLHDDFRIRALDRLEQRVRGPDWVDWKVGEELPENAGRIVAVILNPIYPNDILGPAEVVPLSGVVSLPQEIPPFREGPLSRITSSPDGAAGCSDSDARIEIRVPTGEHLISVFFERYSYNCYGDKFGTAPVTDLMNPAAVEAFIRLTHEEYEKRFPEYLGSVVRATFTDEPPSDTPGWSRVLLDEFRIRKGYDLLPYLPCLFHWVTEEAGGLNANGGEARTAGQVRFDYSDVVSQLYEESFLGKIESWANRCGVVSTGHLLLEETLLFHARYMGDFFRCQRRLHYPGIDYIFPGEIPAVTCKIAASVAHLYGKERVISECFALTGWGFEPEHMKWMTDWQIVNGIDLLVPHAFFYSITEEEAIPPMDENLGFRWFDCPPSMFYQQPYWDYYAHYADYARRLCYLITRGTHECSIALYYPIESVQADFIPASEHCDLHTFRLPGTWMTPGYRWDATSMEQTDTHFRAAGNLLRDHGLDYDIVDDDSLRKAAVGDGTLEVRGTRRYRAVLLPRTRWISSEVYGRIAQFHRCGGIVAATGCLPRFACEGPDRDYEVQRLSEEIFSLTPDRADAELRLHHASIAPNPRAALYDRPGTELSAYFRSEGLGDFQASEGGLYAQHRRIGTTDAYFIAHHERGKVTQARVRLKGGGVPVILDPEDGRSYRPECWAPCEGGIEIDHAFEPNQAFFVLVGPEGKLPRPVGSFVDVRSLTQVGAVETKWKLTPDGGDTHPMRMRDMPEHGRSAEPEGARIVESLATWEEGALPGFSGGGTYDAVFRWDGTPGEELFLDLGEVGVAARVFLNEVDCGVRMWKPYRYRVSAAIRTGENRLRIRVVNTLANAIQETYGTGRTPTAASEERVERFARFGAGTLRSGLLGPVRIMRAGA